MYNTTYLNSDIDWLKSHENLKKKLQKNSIGNLSVICIILKLIFYEYLAIIKTKIQIAIFYENLSSLPSSWKNNKWKWFIRTEFNNE